MQQADGSSRGSPGTTEKDVQKANKPKLEPPLDTQAKKDAAAHVATGAGGGGGGSAVGIRLKGTVKINMSLFECFSCFCPLKPPVFQCADGYLACGGCHRGLMGGSCILLRSTAMDALVSAARVECPHDGCRVNVVYHELSDHQSACPHAPCSCPEPGCGFVGPPPALVAHLTARHSVPVHKFKYGKDFDLKVPATEPSRWLLHGEGDDRAFLVSVGALGAATAVWVVWCASGQSAAPRPQYKCSIMLFLGPKWIPDRDYVLVKMNVMSSTSPGALVNKPFLTE